MNDKLAAPLTIIGLIVLITVGYCWATHITTCFVAGLWGYLVAGAIFFPIGIIHGAGILLGIW